MNTVASFRFSSVDFLETNFASLSPDALLDYFQNRSHIRYFPLSSGKPEHVLAANKILNNEFNFNHETYRLEEDFNWKKNPSRDVEWLILLHKFYYSRDLACAFDYSRDERYARKWMDLISTWIAQVPDGFIDSQVTGRRLQQWLLAYQYLVPGGRSGSINAEFLLSFLESINSQTQYLQRHLTPEGNHRTIELYAIFSVAVLFPELRGSSQLLSFALEELALNLRQDFLADGVHRELSTDYHHIVLKNFLRAESLARLNGIQVPAEFRETLHQALQFSIYTHKPDGFIPAINDGDSNSYLSLLKKACALYPDPELVYAATRGKEGKPPAQRSCGFTKSGYYMLRSDWAQKPYEDSRYLFFDCAGLGFGSHGHYDLLSFEMAAFGRSLIVDPGRFTYSENHGDGRNWRRVFKGTAYHNTVVIDGKDQVPYRCNRPAHPEPEAVMKKFVTDDGFDLLHGQAITEQYNVVHDRIIFFAAQEYWLVKDILEGDGLDHRYDLYLHLSQKAFNQVQLNQHDEGTVIHSPNLLVAQADPPGNIHASIEQGFISPAYGLRVPAPILKFSQSSSASAVFHTLLYPYGSTRPDLRLTRLPIYQNGCLREDHKAVALKIEIRTGLSDFEDIFFIDVGQSDHGTKYDFGDIQCTCRMLYLRRDAQGMIIHLHAIEIDHLVVGSQTLVKDLNGVERLGYRNNRLELSDGTGQQNLMLDPCVELPKWTELQQYWRDLCRQ